MSVLFALARGDKKPRLPTQVAVAVEPQMYATDRANDIAQRIAIVQTMSSHNTHKR
jgi:hypothetical protein